MEEASPERVSSLEHERGGFGMVGIEQDDQMQLSRALFPGFQSPPGCHREVPPCYAKSQVTSISGKVNNGDGSVNSSDSFDANLFETIGHGYPSLNLMGLVGVSGNYTANSLSLQTNSARHIGASLYPESVWQCKSYLLPTVPSNTLFPASVSSSSMKFFNDGCLEVMETSNHEHSIGLLDEKKFRARECHQQQALQLSKQPLVVCPAIEGCINHSKDTGLVLILQKELTKSDVGTVGRIVLPKKEAEANLPPLVESDGMLLHMEDMKLPVTWRFKYRFWPNNKSRMYVMEITGDFVRAHGLQTGDLFNIYRNAGSGKYIVVGRKSNRPTISGNVTSSTCTRPHCSNEDRNSLRRRMAKYLQGRIEPKSLGHSLAVATAGDGSFYSGSQTFPGMIPCSSCDSHLPLQEIDLDSVSFEG